jgi:hypothetical protein
VTATEKRRVDRELYDWWKAMFGRPEYLLERELRPWLLDQAVRRLKELDRSDLSMEEEVDLIVLRSDLELAQELRW